MKISEHFTLSEVTKSATAIRNGIDNYLPEQYYGNARKVALNILEPVRAHFNKPITPSSWYRCLELNRLMKSCDNSQHTTASAVDFEIAGVDNIELAEWVSKNCDFDQLILEFYHKGEPSSGWVHASYVSPEANEREVLWTPDGKQFFGGLPL